MIINNPFNGKLNLDVAEYRISQGDYIDALNVTKDAEGTGQDRVISNILGNSILPYTLPSGVNKIIGFFPDKIRNRAYYFLWNSNGFNSILYYDVDLNLVKKILVSKTDSAGVDILNFDPSYKILSVNIFYRDREGDILFFNDGLNPPKNINVAATYVPWKLSYLLVAKAPPVMVPKVTYENDTTVSINNLRNSLFQFCYRFVYDNNEKSVWSSNSIVPLPQQPSLNFTDNTFTNNSRISISLSTGPEDVKNIEVAFRQTTNGITSDWFLIESISKENLILLDNDIYTFNFYNDSIYVQLDVIETSQLQDWVPQKANAAELANGNVLLYSGITEGYDKTNMNLSVFESSAEISYYYDQCGLLFFATVNGIDNGSGTLLNIYLYGTGTNSSLNNVTTLNNSAGNYFVNLLATNGTNISASFATTASVTNTVSSILSGISAALVLKGFTQVTLNGNKLTMRLTAGFTLLSTGVKTFVYLTSDNTRFANVWDSGYQYAIQYFDQQGRTIGAQTSVGGTVTTPPRNLNSIDPSYFPTINLSILNRPPLYASYYQVLRSNNTTYNKRLCWVSESAYSGIVTNGNRFFYIGIDNISAYNESISSTQNVVSYNYTEGDRIRFIARYDANNVYRSIPSQFDYEIVGTVASIEYNIDYEPPLTIDRNSYISTGNFLKIKYPYSDIGPSFQFPGTSEFQHYEILIYNYSVNSSSSQRFYYEFGKSFGIGNPGTSTRYHFGMSQLSDGGAVVPVNNGDLFYRLRNVPFSDNYNYTSDAFEIKILNPFNSRSDSFPITVPRTVDNAAYTIQTQSKIEVFYDSSPGTPVWATPGFLFYNKSSVSSIQLAIKGTLQILSDGTSTFSVYAVICNNTIPFIPRYKVSILPVEVNSLIQNVTTSFEIDRTIAVDRGAKVWIVATSTNDSTGDNNIIINAFNFDFNVVKSQQIAIIESSFNDNINLSTNSNGRPSVIDENAKQVYFPTLIRFGGEWQANTNLNNINRFIFENFDEYDRTFGDVLRLHVRDRYLKVYQKFKVGNVPILTQIVKDVTGNPLQANTDQLINKIQYYAGDYGIGDAATSLAWNNFADYFVDNYRGVVCRLSQDGITPISITNQMNSFFASKLPSYRQELNTNASLTGPYTGNSCIYGVFDAYTNKYVIAMEEINRYKNCDYNGGTAVSEGFTTTSTTSTTSTTTIGPITSSTSSTTSTTSTTASPFVATRFAYSTDPNVACSNWELQINIANRYIPFAESPVAVGSHLYSTPSVANPAPPGFYARSSGISIYVFQIIDFYGTVANSSICSQDFTTTSTTTIAPPPTYEAISADAIGYNQSNLPNTGICCIQKILYVNAAGQFQSYPNPPNPVPEGYTRVTQFWVDNNGVPYFNNASVMYVNMSLTIPAPEGYYGGQANGYRRIQGSVGLFSTSVTSCENVDCP